jgi:hypothetical protein
MNLSQATMLSTIFNRVAAAGLATFFLVAPSSSVESNYSHSAKSSRQYDGITHKTGPADLSSSVGAGPLGSLMGAAIVECGVQTAVLRRLPIGMIVDLTHPDDAQTVAIENVRRSVQHAANAMLGNCPSEVPGSLMLRVAAAQRVLEIVERATSFLRDPLETFFETLHDEQKARLAAGLVEGVDAGGAIADSAQMRGKDGTGRGNSPTSRVWDCGLWLAELRNWPLPSVERSLGLTARQRGAFYELAASFQFAADNLEDACPAETPPTPVGRLIATVESLEALRGAVEIISAPLRRLHKVLDESQQARLGARI